MDIIEAFALSNINSNKASVKVSSRSPFRDSESWSDRSSYENGRTKAAMTAAIGANIGYQKV